jgi:hypothetical protein
MLHLHASENHVSKIRSIILSGEAKIDEEDGNGWTVSLSLNSDVLNANRGYPRFQALHYAAFAGSESVSALKILIELQADIDHVNHSGNFIFLKSVSTQIEIE